MTKEKHFTTPASRLLIILEKARSTDSTNELSFVRRWWASIFDIPNAASEQALIEVISRLLELRNLFVTVIDQLSGMDNINEELYIEPIRQMSSCINLNQLESNTAPMFRSLLTDVRLQSLRFAVEAYNFRQEFHEPKVTDDDLESIINEVRGIYDKVSKSKLSKRFRNELLDALNEILQSIHEFKIGGADRLRKGVIQAVGTLAVNKTEIEENKDLDEFQAIHRMLVRLDKIINTANKVYPLMLQAASILPAIADRIK